MIRGLEALRGRLSPWILQSLSNGAATGQPSVLHASCRLCSSSSASNSEASSSGESSETQKPADVKVAQQALQELAQHLDHTAGIAKLAAMSAIYRDIFVAADALHRNHSAIKGVDKRKGRGPSSSADAQPPVPVFPLFDVTKLPDSAFPEGGPKLEQRYMDKITCWSQTAPPHVETSNYLLTGINLFPPQEATYPTYIDFNSALRRLELFKSRKRLKTLRKLRSKKGDKYQLSTWGHHVGEV